MNIAFMSITDNAKISGLEICEKTIDGVGFVWMTE
jgi:hypothetical protein